MTIWWFLSQWREEFSLKWQWTTLHFHFQVLLKDNLTDDNFQRILAVIWESSAQVDYMPKTPFSLLVSFSDPGGDNLPVHREQEASDLLQNPLGNPQSPLRLLLWGPHTKGWNSYQVNRSSLLHAQLILILVLLLIPMLLVIPTLVTDFAANSGCVSFCSFTLQTPQTWSVATTGSGSRSSATCKYAEYNYDFSP